MCDNVREESVSRQVLILYRQRVGICDTCESHLKYERMKWFITDMPRDRRLLTSDVFTDKDNNTIKWCLKLYTNHYSTMCNERSYTYSTLYVKLIQSPHFYVKALIYITCTGEIHTG